MMAYFRPVMKRIPSNQPVPPSIDEAAPLLSPFIVDRLARRKGLAVDSVMKGKGGRRLVRLTDLKTGREIEIPNRLAGLSLYEAKRYLDQLPDRSPST
jgi:hypothetical protein